MHSANNFTDIRVIRRGPRWQKESARPCRFNTELRADRRKMTGEYRREADIKWLKPYKFQNVKSRSRSEEHTSELQSRGHLLCRFPLDTYYTLTNHTHN